MGDCDLEVDNAVEGKYEPQDKISIRRKKTGRKTSEMWNYFTPIDEYVATCNICGLKFSYRTSTTNLRKHVVCKHFGGNIKNAEKIHSALISHNINNDRKEENTTNDRIIDYKERELHTKGSINEPIGMKRQLIETSCDPLIGHYLWKGEERRESDEYDAYAFTIASKLRKMEERQRLYAEKVINDALFKGALDQLSPLSEIVICIASSNSGS